MQRTTTHDGFEGNDTRGVTPPCFHCGEPSRYSSQFPDGKQTHQCRTCKNVKVVDETTAQRNGRLSGELVAWAHAVDGGLAVVR